MLKPAACVVILIFVTALLLTYSPFEAISKGTVLPSVNHYILIFIFLSGGFQKPHNMVVSLS